MKTEPGPDYQRTFTTSTKELLVTAVVEAYRTAEEHYDTSRGSNTRTFGFGLYNYNVHELCRAANASAGTVMILRRYPSFRLQVDAYEIACYKVGTSCSQDIWSSFPGNQGAAPALVREQPSLFPEFEPSMESPGKLVLAHLGNPEDGLEALYLCAPTETDGRRITGWAFVDPLWQKENIASLMTAPVRERVPAEPVTEPEVRPKTSEEKRERKA